MGGLDDFKDILRGALASLGGFGGRMIARLMLMILAGQIYGTGPLGILGQVGALVEILAAIGVLGLKRSLLDMLSREAAASGNIPKLIKEAIVSGLLLAVLLSVILGFVWPLLFHNIEMPKILYAAIPCIVIADVAGAAIRFKRVIKWEVISRCILEPWTFLLMAVLLFGLGFDDTALLVAYSMSLIAAATGILIGFHLAFGLGNIIRAPLVMSHIMAVPVKSFPVGVTDIGVMMFRRVDILILSIFASHEAAGIYYMAQQIVTVPHKIHQLFEPMMSPVVAKLHHAAGRDSIQDTLKRVCRWVFSLQLALTVPLAVFGAQVLGIFGPGFEAGALVLVFLLFAELLDGSFALTETPLIFARPKIPPLLVITALVFEVAAITLLSSLAGALGAAIGFALAMTLLCAARIFALNKFYSVLVLDRMFLWPVSVALLVAGSLMILVRFMPLDQGLYVGSAIIVSILTFLAFLRARGLTSSDKELFRRIKSG